MKDEPLVPGRSYWLKIGSRTVPATVTALKHRIDVDHLDACRRPHPRLQRDRPLQSVDLRCRSRSTPYAANRDTGAFILIDRFSNETAGAGMVDFALAPGQQRPLAGHRPSVRGTAPRSRASRPAVLWFTGLSGAGKSTIANQLEQKLLALGCHTMLLDGDNLRHGLNRDLGFTDTDRVENIRRVGEVAKLMGEAGLIVICSFISPFRADRQMAREIAAPHPFIEVFVDTPIEECMRRDPKGLYAKVKAGEIPNFTGLGSPYEAPENPEIHLRTADSGPDALAERIADELRRRDVLAWSGNWT